MGNKGGWRRSSCSTTFPVQVKHLWIVCVFSALCDWLFLYKYIFNYCDYNWGDCYWFSLTDWWWWILSSLQRETEDSIIHNYIWSYLVKEVGDGLVIITARPGFIVRTGGEPTFNSKLIKRQKRRSTKRELLKTRFMKKKHFHLANLFTGAPQVVYRSVIIFGGINCKKLLVIFLIFSTF